MRIYDRANQLPLRHKGFDFVCPQCHNEYVNEGMSGHKVVCPSCSFEWYVNDSGKPNTVVRRSTDG